MNPEEVAQGLARLEERVIGNDRRVRELREADQIAIKQALAAAEKAVEKAERATSARFESVNEFRAQLADQAQRLMPRAEYDVQHSELARQVAENRDALAKLREQVAVGPADLKRLSMSEAFRTGEKTGGLDSRAVVFAVIGFLLLIFAAISPHL